MLPKSHCMLKAKNFSFIFLEEAFSNSCAVKTMKNRFFDFPCCILFGQLHCKLVANVRGTDARLCKAAFIHWWKRPSLSYSCPIFFGPLQACRTRDRLTHVRLRKESSITIHDSGLFSQRCNCALRKHLSFPGSILLHAHCTRVHVTLGSPSFPISMNFRKISERGGGSFPIQKISLHFFCFRKGNFGH